MAWGRRDRETSDASAKGYKVAATASIGATRTGGDRSQAHAVSDRIGRARQRRRLRCRPSRSSSGDDCP